jgi:hypothetical protein
MPTAAYGLSQRPAACAATVPRSQRLEILRQRLCGDQAAECEEASIISIILGLRSVQMRVVKDVVVLMR